jgi:hypothetical protein
MADIVESMRIAGESSEATANALALSGFGRMAARGAYACDPSVPEEDDQDGEDEILRWRAAREAARKKEQEPNG